MKTQLELLPMLLPCQQVEELAQTLEVLLHGYLHHAFRTGISEEEAMSHFENIQLLIKALQNQQVNDHSTNQTAA